MNDTSWSAGASASQLPRPNPFDPDRPELPAELVSASADPEPILLLLDASSDPGWASSAAIALAAELARAGGRVVLADLHIEEPALHERLGEENNDGIVDIFLYGASVSRSARPAGNRGFFFIPGGTSATDPAEVYAHPRWEKLLAGFRDARATLVALVPSSADGWESLVRWSTGVVLLGDAERNDLARVPSVAVRTMLVPPGSVWQDPAAAAAPVALASDALPEMPAADAAPVVVPPLPVAPAEDEPPLSEWRVAAPPEEEMGVVDPFPERAVEAGPEGSFDLPPLDLDGAALAGTGEPEVDAAQPEPFAAEPWREDAMAAEWERVEQFRTEPDLEVPEEEITMGAPEPTAPEEEARADAPSVPGDRDDALPDFDHWNDPAYWETNPDDSWDQSDAQTTDVLPLPHPDTGSRHDAPELRVVPEEDFEDEAAPDFVPPRSVVGSRRRGRGGPGPLVWLLVAVVAIAAAVVIAAVVRPDLFGGTPAAGSNPAPADTVGATGTVPPPPPAPVAQGSELPFAVQVRAFASLGPARAQAERHMRQTPDVLLYVVPETTQGVLYYKVLAGALTDTAAARTLRGRLVEAGIVASADARDDAPGAWNLIQARPLAFSLGEYASRDEAIAQADSLGGRGVPAYPLGVPYSDGTERWRLYAGAFADSVRAEELRQMLRAAELPTRLVTRVGQASLPTP